MQRIVALAAALGLAACSTRIQQLELRRNQLQRMEVAATEVRNAADSGAFEPARYDLYLLLNRTMFDTLLASFDGMQVVLDADGRPIDFTLSRFRVDFRPGYPGLALAAIARDRRSGLEAAVDLDSRLLVERDSTGAMFLRVVASRLVPQVKWGPFDFTRARFARELLALEATKLTERLPRLALPVKTAFSIGGPAGGRQVTWPAGEGSITGDIAFPATLRRGQVAVKQILSLNNGIHLFANVEAIQ